MSDPAAIIDLCVYTAIKHIFQQGRAVGSCMVHVDMQNDWRTFVLNCVSVDIEPIKSKHVIQEQ